MLQRRACPTWWQKLKNRFFRTHLSILSDEHWKPSTHSKNKRTRKHSRRQSSNPNQRRCRRRKKKSRRSGKVAHFRQRRLLPLNPTSNSTRRPVLGQFEWYRLMATLPCSDFFWKCSRCNSRRSFKWAQFARDRLR